MVPYDVLLSYPNVSQPNYIAIVDAQGNEVTSIHVVMKTLIILRVVIFFCLPNHVSPDFDLFFS